MNSLKAGQVSYKFCSGKGLTVFKYRHIANI